MSSQPWPDRDLVFHLTVKVRPVAAGSGWEWQLVDARDGSVFETELQYESAIEARDAGLARLAELTPPLPGAKAGARRELALMSHLIIVSRHEDALYGLLDRVFGDSEGVDVIQDRRRSLSPYRGGRDRRGTHIEPEAQGQGWWMVRSVCPPLPLRAESA